MKSHVPVLEQDVTCSSGLHGMDDISWPDWNQQPSLKLSDYDSNLVYVKTLEHLSEFEWSVGHKDDVLQATEEKGCIK